MVAIWDDGNCTYYNYSGEDYNGAEPDEVYINRNLFIYQLKKSAYYGTFRELTPDEKDAVAKEAMARRHARQEKERRDREAAVERAKRRREEKREQERRLAEEKQKKLRLATSQDTPEGYVNPFAGDNRAIGVHAESPMHALLLCLSNLGRVDIEYIALISGMSLKEVIQSLKGSIYQNPLTWGECFYKGWETADEYLSGDIGRKLELAESVNSEYSGVFSLNVSALRNVMPQVPTAKDIYVTLGSPWVPTDVIDEFIMYMSGRRKKYCKASHDLYTGAWELSTKDVYSNYFDFNMDYGTPRINALEILERTLNMKSVSVYDEELQMDPQPHMVHVLNKEDTLAALEKQRSLIEGFQQWVWTNPARRKKLEEIYTKMFCCNRKRVFNGDFLTFPGMAPVVSLYKYQRDAVARIIRTPNTLLAHEVGAGKTYVMAAAGMELKRMGISKKNMYVVPNNILGQWGKIFMSIYPNADLLIIDPTRDFNPIRRQGMLWRIMNEDHDAIIMTYSSFHLIPVSYSAQEAFLNEQLQEMHEAGAYGMGSKLRRRITATEKKLSKLQADAAAKPDQGICFDELGVTQLFIDEAHNFKNLPVETNIDRVLGLTSSPSAKCEDMYTKIRIVQAVRKGGGVVFATGTPVTNSVSETFVMQKYLQYDKLKEMGIHNFDSWAAMFGEKVTDFEIDVDTSGYRLATRFSRFHNLPELTALLGSMADFHNAETSEEVPKTDGYTDCLVQRSKDFEAYLKDISRRADAVRHGEVDKHVDNMLCITTDGRLAALDLRLVWPDSGFKEESKVVKCADNAAHIYKRYSSIRGTQLIFCDTSTPKDQFNIYDELRRLLVLRGIPKKEIAYIHNATTDAKRLELFNSVRSGEVRILIGSTFKMGLGMNVQDRLIAIHHIDIPWRPADMVQREGRILRPGNMNEKVFIFRYITEGSFDAYSWQILENKQRFISELLSGSYTARSGGDVKDTVLDYAEVKALAVGNPLIKMRVETANELASLLTLKRKYIEGRQAMEQELMELPQQIEDATARADACAKDYAFYTDLMKEYEGLSDWIVKRREASKARKAASSSSAPAEPDFAALLAAMPGAPSQEALQAGLDQSASDAAAAAEAAGTEAAGTSSIDDTAEETPEEIAEEDAGLSEEEKAENKKFRALENKLLAARKEIREPLAKALKDNAYSLHEEPVGTYRGFAVSIPAGMDPAKPYIWLRREGRYVVELGSSKQGYLVRIENYLESMDKLLKKYQDRSKELTARRKYYTAELKKTTDYDSKIDEVQERLSKIDEDLGVDDFTEN
ncbi:MAG: DEAD/DEAH box helicase family protein [Clostridia bacterium]|nr:DEAD/DEAH box helicase family protein [Clostridia bacterium]